MIDGCSLELCVENTFSGAIWHCATEINSVQLYDSFVMVLLESLSLHYITLQIVCQTDCMKKNFTIK